jgi:predicted DNA-binding transcriptional regulator YafY
MPRNAEVIRQWSLLRDLEASRSLTIDDMASRTGVTTRTIRRDLEALQEAGFPLFDEMRDGKRYWKLEQRAFRRLDDTGFNLAELSALYFTRTLAEGLAAAPFQDDVRRAFDKLASALTPGMRQFLDRLPLAVQAKADPGVRPSIPAGPASGAAKPDPKVAQLLDATLHHRRVQMQYHSFSSNREKGYLVEPQRLVFAQGGLYLLAFVPEYDELRTFAVDRIRALSVTEDRFEPQVLPEDAFAHSLGVHHGTPQAIAIAFEPSMSRYIRERIWHPSQTIEERPDGGLVLRLTVSNDWALRSWILGFGPLARVEAPAELAAQLVDELERTRARYQERARSAPQS